MIRAGTCEELKNAQFRNDQVKAVETTQGIIIRERKTTHEFVCRFEIKMQTTHYVIRDTTLLFNDYQYQNQKKKITFNLKMPKTMQLFFHLSKDLITI